MRYPMALTLALTLAFPGCGAGPGSGRDEEVTADRAMTDDSASGANGVGEGTIGGLNTEVHLEPEIARAWSGVRVRVVDTSTGGSLTVDAQLGQGVELGDSGLALFADVFIPDFLMDEGGIHSRSAETHNPAARIIISEGGAADYHGWLFAAMPEIHPYPHERYRILLVEGIPADVTPSQF